MRVDFRLFFLVVLVGWTSQPLPAGNPETTLQISATDPAQGGVLPLNRTFYIKIHYVSSQPIRLTASGQFQGQKIQDITNPSAVYPAGTGDGLVWISYRAPTQIDEICITAADDRWQPLSTLLVPITASWAPNAPDPPEASWVREMSAVQQREVSAAMQQSHSDTGLFGWTFFALLYVSVLGYPVLQIYSLWRDGWMSLSSLPLLAMIPLFAYTIFAFAMQSNLWPILLLFGSPFAFLYLLAIRIWRWWSARVGAGNPQVDSNKYSAP